MSDAVNIRARLAKCFSAVFGGGREEEIYTASLGSMPDWDSVATITIVSLIEQEFGIRVEVGSLEDFVSFDRILDYLERPQNTNRFKQV